MKHHHSTIQTGKKRIMFILTNAFLCENVKCKRSLHPWLWRSLLLTDKDCVIRQMTDWQACWTALARLFVAGPQTMILLLLCSHMHTKTHSPLKLSFMHAQLHRHSLWWPIHKSRGYQIFNYTPIFSYKIFFRFAVNGGDDTHRLT